MADLNEELRVCKMGYGERVNMKLSKAVLSLDPNSGGGIKLILVTIGYHKKKNIKLCIIVG